MRADHPKPFRLELERIALGEVAGTGSPEEALELKALAQSSREILEELPVDLVLREVERRRRVAIASGDSNRRYRLYVGVAFSALAVVAVALLVIMGRADQQEAVIATHEVGAPYAGHGDTRSKGDARLLIHLQTDDGSKQLQDHDEAKAYDRLQLTYLAAGQRYGVIVSLDGRDTVTQHLPEEGSDAVLLAQDKQTLDSSYELDDAPEFERFYFVTSSTEFSVNMVVKATTTAATEGSLKLHLPNGFQQEILTVQKAQP